MLLEEVYGRFFQYQILFHITGIQQNQPVPRVDFSQIVFLAPGPRPRADFQILRLRLSHHLEQKDD